MRAIVAGLSGFFRVKMLFPGTVQSITSRAAFHRFVVPKSVRPPVRLCAYAKMVGLMGPVGAGQLTLWRPRRAMINSRCRVVGSP